MSDQKIELASVKKANTIDTISKEEFEQRIKIIAHSKRDICWWAEQYFKIVSLNTGLGTIQLYPKQKELLDALVKNERSIILATRQVGKCLSFWSFITIRNKKFKWLKIKLPIGLFYMLKKLKIFK